jgi:hypothetical protein
MEQANGYDQQADIWCAFASRQHATAADLSLALQVSRHHAAGVGAWACALCKVSTHEGTHDDAAEPATNGKPACALSQTLIRYLYTTAFHSLGPTLARTTLAATYEILWPYACRRASWVAVAP